MPKGLRNWSYKDVRKFLKKHGFEFYKQLPGSHESYIKVDDDGKQFVVEVNKIKGREAYPPRTLETMIRQSGIDKKVWRKG